MIERRSFGPNPATDPLRSPGTAPPRSCPSPEAVSARGVQSAGCARGTAGVAQPRRSAATTASRDGYAEAGARPSTSAAAPTPVSAPYEQPSGASSLESVSVGHPRPRLERPRLGSAGQRVVGCRCWKRRACSPASQRVRGLVDGMQANALLVVDDGDRVVEGVAMDLNRASGHDPIGHLVLFTLEPYDVIGRDNSPLNEDKLLPQSFLAFWKNKLSLIPTPSVGRSLSAETFMTLVVVDPKGMFQPESECFARRVYIGSTLQAAKYHVVYRPVEALNLASSLGVSSGTVDQLYTRKQRHDPPGVVSDEARAAVEEYNEHSTVASYDLPKPAKEVRSILARADDHDEAISCGIIHEDERHALEPGCTGTKVFPIGDDEHHPVRVLEASASASFLERLGRVASPIRLMARQAVVRSIMLADWMMLSAAARLRSSGMDA